MSLETNAAEEMPCCGREQLFANESVVLLLTVFLYTVVLLAMLLV